MTPKTRTGSRKGPAWPLLYPNPQTEQAEGQLDFEFTSSKVAKLSNKARITKWKQLAEQAEHRGELAIAKQWRKIADEIEALGEGSI